MSAVDAEAIVCQSAKLVRVHSRACQSSHDGSGSPVLLHGRLPRPREIDSHLRHAVASSRMRVPRMAKLLRGIQVHPHYLSPFLLCMLRILKHAAQLRRRVVPPPAPLHAAMPRPPHSRRSHALHDEDALRSLPRVLCHLNAARVD